MLLSLGTGCHGGLGDSPHMQAWPSGPTYQTPELVVNRWAVHTPSRVSNLLKGHTQLDQLDQLDQNTELVGFYSFCRCRSVFSLVVGVESLGVVS